MVTPGSKTALDIDLNSAQLTVRAAPVPAERAANTIYSVFAIDAADVPATEAVYEPGSSEEVSTILSAGKWRVTASDSQDRRGQADIELGVGEHRSLDIALK